MPSWETYRVEPSLSVAVTREMPVLAPGMEATVADLWRAALIENPGLFNGRVFSVDDITPGRLFGHWSEYRRVVARLRRPDLASALAVRPLAVAGLLEGPDGIVFGRRPATAVYQPNVWQLAPAGNVDPSAAFGDEVDVVAALLIELREELGLSPDQVREPRPLCLVQHPSAGILDLCVALRTTLHEAEIHAAHLTHGDGEYPEIAVVPRAAMQSFVRESGETLGPQVGVFLAQHGVLA